MQDTTSNNKRIAKNTIMLYIRMFISMLVGLYTSRVVLATLGVEDYGIYGVVGGVIGMMGFLNASMSGATSRFLTFELGRGDKDRLAKTFSSALIVHIGIAIVVLILAETVGLWFVCNKLNIPAERMQAAHWVYQLSILSAMFGITQVPYNAAIIAHEKMDVYAYIEILNVTLKLLIVYLLTIGDFDKLKLYAVLTFAVSLIIMMIYRIYCLRHFKESRFHWVWDKSYLKPLLSFSCWDLYGNACVTARQQGTNFLVNIFFGVTYNAASSVATTVNGVVLGLTFTLIPALQPQIVKRYAVGDIKGLQSLMNNGIKYFSLLYLALLFPFLMEADQLFTLWLGTPPEYAATFCRILLFSFFLSAINAIINNGIHATGNIKYISIITGSIYLLNLPVSYIFLKEGASVEWTYYIFVITNLLIVISDIIILKKLIASINVFVFIKTIFSIFFVTALCSLPSYAIYCLIPPTIVRFIFVFGIEFLIVFGVSYRFLLDESTKASILAKLTFSK